MESIYLMQSASNCVSVYTRDSTNTPFVPFVRMAEKPLVDLKRNDFVALKKAFKELESCANNGNGEDDLSDVPLKDLPGLQYTIVNVTQEDRASARAMGVLLSNNSHVVVLREAVSDAVGALIPSAVGHRDIVRDRSQAEESLVDSSNPNFLN